MFTVSVHQSKPEAEANNYPCLKVSENAGLIVLFSAPGNGTVLFVNGPDFYVVGDYAVDWDEDSFNLFKGLIEFDTSDGQSDDHEELSDFEEESKELQQAFKKFMTGVKAG